MCVFALFFFGGGRRHVFHTSPHLFSLWEPALAVIIILFCWGGNCDSAFYDLATCTNNADREWTASPQRWPDSLTEPGCCKWAGPSHWAHWVVGQTAHMLTILTAWVDASWGVISVTAEVPQKPRGGWVTRFSKRRRDSRPQKWVSRSLQWVQKEPCVDFLMEWFVSMNRGTQWLMRHGHRFTRNWGSWELCSARSHEFLAFEMEQLYKIRRWAS